MSEFPWNSLFTLVGVIVGFTLSQFADLFKNRRRKSLIKKALRNEFSIVKESLIDAQKKESRLAREKFPLVTDTYDSLKVELASLLKPQNLALVHKAYQQIKQLNKPLGAESIRGHIIIPSGPLLYQHNLNDEITVIEEAINALS